MKKAMGPRRESFDNHSVWSTFRADAKTIIEVIDILSRDLQDYVATLLADVERGNYLGVERAAHQVVGAAGTFSAAQVCDIARRIEVHARHQSMVSVSALCTPLVEARDRLLAELAEWRREIAAAGIEEPALTHRLLSN